MSFLFWFSHYGLWVALAYLGLLRFLGGFLLLNSLKSPRPTSPAQNDSQ